MAKNNDFFEIDLTGYKERRGTHVPEGTYAVRVTDYELTKSNNGNAMMNIWLTIHQPGAEEHGEVILDRLVATPNAAFRVVHFLKAIGMNPPIGQKLRLPGRAVLGKSLLVEVADDTYNNVTRSSVSEYLPDPNASSGANTEDVPDEYEGEPEDEPEWPEATEPTEDPSVEEEVAPDGSTVVGVEVEEVSL